MTYIKVRYKTDTNVFISCPSALKIKGSCYSAPETTESNLIVPKY